MNTFFTKNALIVALLAASATSTTAFTPNSKHPFNNNYSLKYIEDANIVTDSKETFIPRKPIANDDTHTPTAWFDAPVGQAAKNMKKSKSPMIRFES